MGDAEAESGPQASHTLTVPKKLPKGRTQPFPTKPTRFAGGATYILISLTHFQGYSELDNKANVASKSRLNKTTAGGRLGQTQSIYE